MVKESTHMDKLAQGLVEIWRLEQWMEPRDEWLESMRELRIGGLQDMIDMLDKHINRGTGTPEGLQALREYRDKEVAAMAAWKAMTLDEIAETEDVKKYDEKMRQLKLDTAEHYLLAGMESLVKQGHTEFEVDLTDAVIDLPDPECN